MSQANGVASSLDRHSLYTSLYGGIDQQDFPLAYRLYGIFEKLLRVANQPKIEQPNIYLVNSDNWPWAIALPDNSIIISKGTIELCYDGVSLERGDTRLAMVVGHELAHLAKEHYWHQKVYLSLRKSLEEGSDKKLLYLFDGTGLLGSDSDQSKIQRRKDEFTADEVGAIYAALAGYDPRVLLGEEGKSFFHDWARKTSGPDDIDDSDSFLSPKDRATYLQTRLNGIAKMAELFHLGTALTYLGEYSVAKKTMEKIREEFAIYTVLNNLGYIHLSDGIAKNNKNNNDETKFWLPVNITVSAETPILTRGVKNIGEPNARTQLEKAVDFFEQSVKQNPSYLEARLNLATSYFYLQRYEKSVEAFSEAQNLSTDKVDPAIEAMIELARLKMNEVHEDTKDNSKNTTSGKSASAIAEILDLNGLESNYQKFDYLQNAIARLSTLAAQSEGELSVLFNLAQLIDSKGSEKESTKIWNHLRENITQIPKSLRSLVIRKTAGSPIRPEVANYEDTEDFVIKEISSNRLLTGAKFERHTVLDMSIDDALFFGYANSEWHREYFFSSDPLLRVYDVDTALTLHDLETCCGSPISIHKNGHTEVRIYSGNQGFWIQDNRVMEYWKLIK